MVATQSKQRDAMLNALLKLTRKELVRAWTAWRELASAAGNQMNAMRNAVLKMMKAQQAKAMTQWRTVAAEMTAAQLSLGTAMMKLMHAELNRGFTTWLLATREAKTQLSKLKRAMLRMMHVSLTKAWVTWYEFAITGKSDADKMRRCVLRMQSMALATAFTTWRVTVAEGIESARKTKAVLGRMMNRALAAAFTTWRENVREEGNGDINLRRAVLTMLKREISSAYHFWRTSAAQWAHEQEVALQPDSNACLDCCTLDYAGTARTLHQHLYTSIYTTTLHHYCTMSCRYTLYSMPTPVSPYHPFKPPLHCIMPTHSLTLSVVLFISPPQSSSDPRHVQIGQKVLARMVNQGLTQAMYTWRDQTMTGNLALETLANALRSMLNRTLQIAWNTWLYASKGGTEEDDKLISVAKRFMDSALAAAFADRKSVVEGKSVGY